VTGRQLLAALPVVVLACAAPPPLAPPPIWGGLDAGPYWVGYRVVQREDASRPLADGRARPLQVSVWYPAPAAPEVEPMRYRDFVALEATELGDADADGAKGEAAVGRQRERLADAGVAEDAAGRVLEAVTAARRDVPASPGPFPLALFAQGNGSPPHSETVACAYLASHGFVVMTVPSQSRITGFPTSEADVLPKAEEQAADLAWLAAHAGEVSPAPTRGLGVIGYSFGARGALVYQLQSRAAGAMVSVDGGIGNAQGKGFADGAPYFDPMAFTVPLLHVYQPGDEVVDPDFDLIESLDRSDRFLVEVTGLRHGHFSNIGMLRALGPGYDAVIAPDLDPQPAFEATLRYIRAFLHAFLDGDRTDLDALVAAGPGGPVVQVREWPPEGR